MFDIHSFRPYKASRVIDDVNEAVVPAASCEEVESPNNKQRSTKKEPFMTHDHWWEKHSSRSRVVVAFCRPIIITVMTASTLLFPIHTIYQTGMHAWPKHSVKTDTQAVTEKIHIQLLLFSLWIHVSASLLCCHHYFLPSLKGKPIHDLLTRCTYSFLSGNQLMYQDVEGVCSFHLCICIHTRSFISILLRRWFHWKR